MRHIFCLNFLRIILINSIGDNSICERFHFIDFFLTVFGGDKTGASAQLLKHILVDVRGIMYHVHIIVQIADDILHGLEIINFHIVKRDQYGESLFQKIKVFVQFTVYIGTVPPQKRVGRDQKIVVRFRMGGNLPGQKGEIICKIIFAVREVYGLQNLFGFFIRLHRFGSTEFFSL